MVRQENNVKRTDVFFMFPDFSGKKLLSERQACFNRFLFPLRKALGLKKKRVNGRIGKMRKWSIRFGGKRDGFNPDRERQVFTDPEQCKGGRKGCTELAVMDGLQDGKIGPPTRICQPSGSLLPEARYQVFQAGSPAKARAGMCGTSRLIETVRNNGENRRRALPLPFSSLIKRQKRF